jgi:hercynylcysteine S-oxide lyase
MERAAFADASPVLLLESREAHVAGRIGLAAAVSEFLAADPAAVRARLAEVGRQARATLAAVPGWEVVPEAVGTDPTSGSAITALRPLAGQDVTAVRGRLLAEHQIVTTAEFPVRAPRDMTGPLLRVSPHVDCLAADLERLAAVLPAR